ncbi:hypothetical protein IU433_07405 [Nocardia puris]|uniref:Ig-like domain-containing protein n=1 Tax=Nocardia puris TaxID=208602 RepID=A0A366DKW9_9NOCA|nr:hypothetical protein [Nocardia puris]MBF6211365.1 hypothetical protein [Nocardia puris]MBF6365083.1 hypothetical protein [Nocardia puris]MBF6458868.1 hypothetical protein [Nocardia puris]RBO90722.1 hypothetical protein DFR74_105124 [Nocardia puris]
MTAFGFTRHTAGAGLTAFAAVAAVTVLAAPAAHAAVTSVSVDGGNHRVGQTYTITAKVGGASGGLLVYFSVNGEFIGAPKVPWPPGTATIEWTPSQPGEHIITVEQGGSTKSIMVDVGKASSGGSGSSGSAGTGSAGTGSAGRLLGGLLGSS